MHRDLLQFRKYIDRSYHNTQQIAYPMALVNWERPKRYVFYECFIYMLDLIQQKKLNFQNFNESNLTEARFEII